MNDAHRKSLSAIRATLDQARENVNAIRVATEAEYQAMSEDVADGVDGQRMSDAIDELQDACMSLGEAVACLQTAGAA